MRYNILKKINKFLSMKRNNVKNIIIIICLFLIFAFLLLLIPQIRQLLIIITEKIFMHRTLKDHAKWHRVLLNFSIIGNVFLLYFIFFLIYINKLKILFQTNNIKYIILTVIFIMVFLMNYFTIWAADDYHIYNNTWLQGDSFNILKPFNNAKSSYYGMSGRFLSTFLNGILLYFNKNLFNVLNSFVYCSLIYLIYLFIKDEDKDNPLIIFIIFIATWFFIPALGQVVFWQIGSVIYLWTFTIGMFLLLFYVNLFKNNKLKDNITNNVLLFILALIAGNGLETNSIMFIIFLSFILYYEKVVEKIILPKWSIISFIGLIIGTLSNIIAPGNFSRYNAQTGQDILFNKIYYGIGLWFYRGIERSGVYILLILLISVFIIYLMLRKKELKIKEYFIPSVVISFLLMICFSGGLLVIVLRTYKNTVQEFLDWYWLNVNKFNLCVILLITIFIINVILFFINRKTIFAIDDDKNYKNELFIIFLSISAVIGIGSYILVPYAWERSYMGMCIFLLISIIYLIYRISIPKKIIYVLGLLIICSFSFSYKNTLIDAINAKKWEKETKKIIYEKIENNEDIIIVKTFMSKNAKNAASAEKWVIPAIIDYEPKTVNNIHVDYEWININITNYFFKDKQAWNKGKRILGIYE